jgi:hypothetical protein
MSEMDHAYGERGQAGAYEATQPMSLKTDPAPLRKDE